MSKILIVEDDLSIQALLHDFIQEAGYSVILASDGVEALAKYSEQRFDLILLDIMLPKINSRKEYPESLSADQERPPNIDHAQTQSIISVFQFAPVNKKQNDIP